MTGKHVQAKVCGLAVAMALLAAISTASALDFNDVKNLIANQVSEGVIVNMVRQDATLAITQGQADELRTLGASETLVSSIRRVQAAPAPTGAGSFSDGSSYVVDESAAYSAAAPQSGGSLPQSFVATTGETYYLNPSTGTYYQASPSVVVSPAPTVVYEAPTVYASPYYYPYPEYRPRSSWNFSLFFGGGGRHRGGYRGPGGHRGPGGRHWR